MTDKSREHASLELVAACGGYIGAVDATVGFARTVWSAFFNPDSSTKATSKQGSRNFAFISRDDLIGSSSLEQARQIDLIIRGLVQQKAVDEENHGLLLFRIAQALPRLDTITRLLLSGLKAPQDQRYFVMRNVRQRYHARLSPHIAEHFHELAQATNEFRDKAQAGDEDDSKPYRDSIDHAKLVSLLRPLASPKDEIVDLFLECCWAAGYFAPGSHRGFLKMFATAIDSEYLLGCLFGLPTGVTGFDELFGGGGLFLIEGEKNQAPGFDAGMPGRALLIKGEYGIGKSMLAMQLAAEIARKGGAVYVLLMEQGVTEYLYTLESVQALPKDGSVQVAFDPEDIAAALKATPKPGQGVIILRAGVKESFARYLATVERETAKLLEFPLRAIVVDPVNSVIRKDESLTSLRAQAVDTINAVRYQFTHLIFVAEERTDLQNRSDSESNLVFDENVSDTVIRLGKSFRHGYTQRIIEITKSRYQREQRGQHSFSIQPGRGLTIYPSSAAVSARLSARRSDSALNEQIEVLLGIPRLDAVIRGAGKAGLFHGDIIIIRGPEGSLKTQVGLLFLLAPNGNQGRGKYARSLCISTRDSRDAIVHILESEPVHIQSNKKNFKSIDDVDVYCMPARHANPALILQEIETKLFSGLTASARIDRAVIDNVTFWDHNCAHVREDMAFAPALIQLFRRYGVTCVLICDSKVDDPGMEIQRACTDSADAIIQLQRHQDRGSHRIFGSVVKTRDMRHDRAGFELTFGSGGLDVSPVSGLLRVRSNGDVEQVPIRLFLHQESVAQETYNASITDAVKAVLSAKVQLEGQDHVFLRKALQLGKSATVDELQILQLDEYQLPAGERDAGEFIRYSKDQLGDTDLSGDKTFVAGLADNCRNSSNSLIAVPYYANVSLLAYRSDNVLPLHVYDSWESLADACTEWESNHRDGEVFFDFPRNTSENYNCLFFEILSSLRPPPLSKVGSTRNYSLTSWLSCPEAIEAAKLFWMLCQRAYTARNVVKTENSYPDVIRTARVWRHWYSTLNHMLDVMPLAERQLVRVRQMPNDCSVAGDWFLAVPAYSAAPQVGLDIIKFLTSPNAETDRIQRGVGLPTRSEFYRAVNGPRRSPSLASPHFSLNLDALAGTIERSLRRSKLIGYANVAPLLAYQLRRLLEIHADSISEAQPAIEDVLTDIRERVGQPVD